MTNDNILCTMITPRIDFDCAWLHPNNHIGVIFSDGNKHNIPISMIDEDTLDILAERWRKKLFENAGKTPPATTLDKVKDYVDDLLDKYGLDPHLTAIRDLLQS